MTTLTKQPAGASLQKIPFVSGRISRKRFWMNFLLAQLIGAILFAVPIVTGAVSDVGLSSDYQQRANAMGMTLVTPDGTRYEPDATAASTPSGTMAAWSFAGIAAALFSFWVIPIRRFHDRGKSGWWVLLNLVPILGLLWILIESGFLPGNEGRNKYGPPPGATANS